MATHPRYSKAFLEELAALANSPEAARVGQLLQMLEPAAGAPRPPGADLPRRETGPEPIGVWEPRRVDGKLLFVRPDDTGLMDPWGSAQKVWPADKDPRHVRVAFLGESVATGLHYAPEYSFGKILAAQLQAAAGPDVFDFVDLSRSGLMPGMLVEQYRATLQLNPDVIIIMAGNNWRSMLPWDRLAEARALREGGYRQLLAERLDFVRSFSDATMRSLGEVARGGKAKVILVVPENNLVDYSMMQPVAWLPGQGSQQWHELHGRARERLTAGAHEAALELARKMGELDEGTCSTTHRLRADALVGLGRRGEALEAFDAELSCVAGNRWIIELPRIGPQVQDALRQGAREHGFSCVDLPAMLRAGAGSSLPGRETFYDYCHFTVPAMSRVGASLVLEVLRVAGKTPAPGTTVESLEKAMPAPAAARDAVAKLGASMGNSQISDELAEVAEYWGDQALRASEGLIEYMVDHLDMATGATPAVLTQAYRRLGQSAYQKLFWDFPIGTTLEVFCKLASRFSPPAHARMLEVLQGNLGLGAQPVDLSQFLHGLSWRERFMEDFEFGSRGDDRQPFNKGPIHRSPWPTSRFFAVHDGQRDVALELTARMAEVGGPRSGPVTVSVNGFPVGEVVIGPRWSKHALKAPARVWRAGPNRVELHWPGLPAHGEQALRRVAECWEQGSRALPLPVFGEVFSLTARVAS